MRDDHRRVLVERMHSAGEFLHIVGVLGIIGFFVNMAVSRWDRSYALVTMIVGFGGFALGTALQFIPFAMGSAWEREARALERRHRG